MSTNAASILQALMSGQYSPTGIGTNPPGQLGPDPGRAISPAQSTFQGSANPQDQLGQILSALSPYLGFLAQGLQGGGFLGAGGGVTQTPGANPLASLASGGNPSAPTAGNPLNLQTVLQAILAGPTAGAGAGSAGLTPTASAPFAGGSPTGGLAALAVFGGGFETGPEASAGGPSGHELLR